MCTAQNHATRLIRLYRDIFSWLPLATVIDNKILVCHGGVSDKTDLDYLASIDRHQVRPCYNMGGRRWSGRGSYPLVCLTWGNSFNAECPTFGQGYKQTYYCLALHVSKIVHGTGTLESRMTCRLFRCDILSYFSRAFVFQIPIPLPCSPQTEWDAGGTRRKWFAAQNSNSNEYLTYNLLCWHHV